MTLKELAKDYEEKLEKWEQSNRLLAKAEEEGNEKEYSEIDEENDSLYKDQWYAYHKLASCISMVTGIDLGLAHTMVRCHYDRVKKIINAWS